MGTMEDLKPRSQRMYRSRSEKMVAGVCGGIAQYFGIDPVIVRVAFVALGVATGFGLLAYIILAIVVPERPIEEPEPVGWTTSSRGGSEVLAYVLVFVGAVLLMQSLQVFSFISGEVLWPAVLIGVGALLLLKRAQE